MARTIYSLITVRGKLRASSPIHVGGTGFDVDTDLPLARDGQGRFYIPGTSLAGALRDWFRAAYSIAHGKLSIYETDGRDPDEVRDRWGYVEEENGGGLASRIIIDDALADGDVSQEIRDGVGIDRQWGTAAAHIKFDRAVLPEGTTFQFEMHVETKDEEDERNVLSELKAFLDVATQQGFSLGAAVTRGLGRVSLPEYTVERLRLADRQGILQALAGRPEQIDLGPIEAAKLSTATRLRIEINWQPVGPVMVKAGQEGLGVDILPLVTNRGSNVALVIPGSSVKGTLRSHAERIMRTLLGLKADSDQTDDRNRFLCQLDVPLVREVFGYARRRKKNEENEDDENEQDAAEHEPQTSNRGVLRVSDCHTSHAVKEQIWRTLLLASSEQEVLNALQRSGAGIHWDVAFHVAVDRWTGGAAQGMLYTVLEPHAAQWEPIELELDLFRLPEELHLPAIGLLLLLLRDMAAGWIPLGFGTNRGLGAIEVKEIRFQLEPPSEQSPLHALNGVRWDGSLDSQTDRILPVELLDQVRRAWTTYLGELQNALGGI